MDDPRKKSLNNIFCSKSIEEREYIISDFSKIVSEYRAKEQELAQKKLKDYLDNFRFEATKVGDFIELVYTQIYEHTDSRLISCLINPNNFSMIYSNYEAYGHLTRSPYYNFKSIVACIDEYSDQVSYIEQNHHRADGILDGLYSIPTEQKAHHDFDVLKLDGVRWDREITIPEGAWSKVRDTLSKAMR
jgi:hypothetical protein